MGPSQAWWTFLANHIGQLTLISPARSPYAPHADDVIDVSGLPFCQLRCRTMNCTPRLAALSSIGVLRFNGHPLAPMALKTFAKPWPSGTAPAEDRRQHGQVAADPRCLPAEIVAAALDLYDDQRCQTISRRPSLAIFVQRHWKRLSFGPR